MQGNVCFADGWSHAKPRSREGKCTSLCSVLVQASRGRESAGAFSFFERRRPCGAPGPFRTRVACWQLFEIAWRRLSAFRRWVMGVLQTAWFHAKARRREGKQAGLFLVLSQASRGRKSAGVRSFCERRRPYGAPGHFRTRLACWRYCNQTELFSAAYPARPAGRPAVGVSGSRRFRQASRKFPAGLDLQSHPESDLGRCRWCHGVLRFRRFRGR